MALNCYNQINLIKFPSQHDHTLSLSGPTSKMPANVIYETGMSIWYPDSCATNHATYDVGNIQKGQAYSGNKSNNAADGRLMNITHFGTSSLYSSNRNYMLNDLLTVPTASKNLLSVKRFWCDNRVSIEFDPQTVRTKNLGTRETLFVGKENEGLHELQLRINESMQVNQAEIGVKASARTWHLRLGHLHSQVMASLNKKKLISLSDID